MRKRLAAGVLGTALWALMAVAPAAALAGSIAGTVTDAAHEPISGIYVCAVSPGFLGPFGGCGFTGPSGEYAIEDVEPGGYLVEFRDESQSLNYVTEYYDDSPTPEGATLVEVGGEPVTGIDAELAAGGKITGTVTDSVTGLPIEGVQVCAPPVDLFERESGTIYCDRTGAAGEYEVNSLATGSYKVEFFVEESPNYITELYDGKSSWDEADPVAVTAGATTAGIDAALDEGIQITGTLTDAATAEPAEFIRICALDPVTEARRGCAFSKPDGTYSIAGLPLGTYVVIFAEDDVEDGVVLHSDGYVRQYYDDKPTFAAADRIGGPTPGVLSGIDAALVQGPEVFPAPPGEEPPLVGPPPPSPQPGTPIQPRRRCKKGFHKKKVKGRYRCVRKKRHRHKHRHRR